MHRRDESGRGKRRGDVKKAELHCHVDQLLDAEMVSSLSADGVDLGFTGEEFRRIWPATTFDEWMAYMRFLTARMRPADTYFAILAKHVQRLIKQEVTYAEIMVGGLLFAHDDLGQVLDLYRRGRAQVDAAARGRIQVEFLVAVGAGPVPKLERQVPRALALHKAGLVRGLALAGDDRQFPLGPMIPVLREAKDSGMKLEIHTGEWSGPEAVKAALDSGLPDRLGHAVAAFKDPVLVDRIQESDMHIEFCPTSNLKTGAVGKIEEHPIRVAKERGMNFGVNTDDPGPFACSMNSEYALLARELGFTDGDFARIHENTIRSAFVRA